MRVLCTEYYCTRRSCSSSSVNCFYQKEKREKSGTSNKAMFFLISKDTGQQNTWHRFVELYYRAHNARFSETIQIRVYTLYVSKINLKFALEQAIKVHRGSKRYSSTLSLTSALDGGGWLTPRPGRFTPGKDTRYPLYRRMGGPQGRSGRVRKTSPSQGFEPQTVQPIASRYTD